MNDKDRPAIYIEIIINDFDGISIIFQDYKISDAPILIVNSLINQSLIYSQIDDT